MGKYMDAYKRLVEQKNTMNNLHNRTMAQYSYLMSDEAKEWNRVHQSLRDSAYDRELETALAKALEEVKQEAVESVMKNISVEFQNNASKPLQDLEKQIKNLFS